MTVMFSDLLELLDQIQEEVFNMNEIRDELEITEDQVRVRAFEIFMGRVENGKEPHGYDVMDWLQAEAELAKQALDETLVVDISDILEAPIDELIKEE